MNICKRYPDRTLLFYEDELRSGIESFATKLSEFLGVPRDERWLVDVRKACMLNPSYEVESTTLRLYRELLEREFSDDPYTRQKLLDLVVRH